MSSGTRIGRMRRKRPSSRTLGLANAYRTQIAAAIRGGYPKLAAAIGEVAFDALVVDYLARYPSTRLSVRGAGAQLPELLAESPQSPAWQAELAQLDRAYSEVLDAAGVELVQHAEAFDPEQPFRLAPAHALVELTTTADELWRAVDHGLAPTFPRELDWPRTVLVWRTAHGVSQRVVAIDEGTVLRAASRGVTLEHLCARLKSPNPIARALDLVVRWIADGVVARQ